MAVIAYHLIWTNYGTWLPNDLRGSGSHDVYTPALAELGRPHFGRKAARNCNPREAWCVSFARRPSRDCNSR